MTPTAPHSRGAQRDDEPASALSGRPGTRRWRITTLDGYTAEGHLPDWATTDPSEQEILKEELAAHLADITHHAPFPGQAIRVYSPAHRDGQAVEYEVLHGSIDCTPYAEPPEPRVPVVNLRLTDECWITDLGPEAIADLAAKLRAQADRLDHEVRPTLFAARTDWATHHTAAPPAAPGKRTP